MVHQIRRLACFNYASKYGSLCETFELERNFQHNFLLTLKQNTRPKNKPGVMSYCYRLNNFNEFALPLLVGKQRRCKLRATAHNQQRDHFNQKTDAVMNYRRKYTK